MKEAYPIEVLASISPNKPCEMRILADCTKRFNNDGISTKEFPGKNNNISLWRTITATEKEEITSGEWKISNGSFARKAINL